MPQYDEKKATQIAAFFISRSPNNKISRMKLLKLMYIAERESFRVAGEPMTYDNYCSMPHGPVLSITYGKMRYDENDTYWSEYISREGNRDLQLERDPGIGKLNREEMDILEDVFRRYGHYTASQLRHLTHQFDEYTETDSSIPIRYEEIMKSLGIPTNEINQLLNSYSEAAEL